MIGLVLIVASIAATRAVAARAAASKPRVIEAATFNFAPNLSAWRGLQFAAVPSQDAPLTAFPDLGTPDKQAHVGIVTLRRWGGSGGFGTDSGGTTEIEWDAGHTNLDPGQGFFGPNLTSVPPGAPGLVRRRLAPDGSFIASLYSDGKLFLGHDLRQDVLNNLTTDQQNAENNQSAANFYGDASTAENQENAAGQAIAKNVPVVGQALGQVLGFAVGGAGADDSKTAKADAQQAEQDRAQTRAEWGHYQ